MPMLFIKTSSLSINSLNWLNSIYDNNNSTLNSSDKCFINCPTNCSLLRVSINRNLFDGEEEETLTKCFLCSVNKYLYFPINIYELKTKATTAANRDVIIF